MQLLPQPLSPLRRHGAQGQPQRGALAADGETQGLQQGVGEGGHQGRAHAVAKHLVQGPEPGTEMDGNSGGFFHVLENLRVLFMRYGTSRTC